MTFEVHSEILSHTIERVKVRACTRMCACCASGEVFCVDFPSRAWQLLQLERETLNKKKLETEQGLYANSET